MKKYTGTLQAFVRLEEDEVQAWPMTMPVPARTLARVKNIPRDDWDIENVSIAIPATQVKMALGKGMAVIRHQIKDHLMVYEEVAFFATPLYPKGMYSTFQYFN